MTSAFYEEFTNWEAVFIVIEQHINQKEFVDKMFHLLKFVYKFIKCGDLADAEKLQRTHAQSAIQCLTRIDRRIVHVDTVDQLICAILHTDEELKLIRNVSSILSDLFLWPMILLKITIE